MLPQFFDMIGVRAQGQGFEVFFWSVLIVAGIIVCVREFRAKRPFNDSWYGYGVGIGLLVFGGMSLISAAQGVLYFEEDGLKISNYGLAIAIAFVVGIWLAVREANRSPSPPTMGHLFDLSFWILIFGMVGARVLFIIVSFEDYVNLCVAPELVEGSEGVKDCFAVLKFWKGGLVFFGGFLGAAIAALVYTRKHKISFLRAADVMIPSLALGHFFGRLGCLSAGCCFGQQTNVPWSVSFPQGAAPFQAEFEGLRTATPANPDAWVALLERGHSALIHPTQLYEASAEFLFFVMLILMRPRKRFHGQLVATWLVLYSMLRFVVEFYRGDKIRGFVFEYAIAPLNSLFGLAPEEPTILSTSQTIGLITLLTGVVIYVTQRPKRTSSS